MTKELKAIRGCQAAMDKLKADMFLLLIGNKIAQGQTKIFHNQRWHNFTVSDGKVFVISYGVTHSLKHIAKIQERYEV